MQLGWGSTDKLLSFKGLVVKEEVTPARARCSVATLPEPARTSFAVAEGCHGVPAPGSGAGRTVLQTQIREEVGAENTIKVPAVNGVEMKSRDYAHCLFSWKNCGTSNEASRSQAKNNK